MIKCPNTGQYIKTGIAMDRKSFETVEMSGNSTLCPACGDTHVWSKKDVHWIEPLAGPRSD